MTGGSYGLRGWKLTISFPERSLVRISGSAERFVTPNMGIVPAAAQQVQRIQAFPGASGDYLLHGVVSRIKKETCLSWFPFFAGSVKAPPTVRPENKRVSLRLHNSANGI